MLDLKAASKKVDELISKITKEEFENWVIEDRQREEQAFLLYGHPLKFCSGYSRILIKEKETAHKAVSSFCMSF